MHLKIAVPDRHISAPILQSALETATRANEAILRAEKKVPSIARAIKDGVRWRPELPGTGESLDLAPVVLSRGWGDCDDLAPWLAAELRATGRDPGARAVAHRSGKGRWHAVVRTSSGEILDPSLWAGMRSGRHALEGAPVIDPLADSGRRALALIPQDPEGRRWSARVDLPSRRHLHVCAVASGDSPQTALIRAAQSAAYSAPGESEALDAVLSGLCGVAEGDGEQMGFLGDLVRTATGIVSAIPGIGPVAQQIARTVAPVARAVAPAAQAVSPWVSTVSPAAGLGLQALPLVQSILDALTRSGAVQGQPAAVAPALPASPILPGYGQAYALPLPIPGLQASAAWQPTAPGAPSPVVVRW